MLSDADHALLARLNDWAARPHFADVKVKSHVGCGRFFIEATSGNDAVIDRFKACAEQLNSVASYLIAKTAGVAVERNIAAGPTAMTYSQTAYQAWVLDQAKAIGLQPWDIDSINLPMIEGVRGRFFSLIFGTVDWTEVKAAAAANDIGGARPKMSFAALSRIEPAEQKRLFQLVAAAPVRPIETAYGNILQFRPRGSGHDAS